jgi:hypothetical protein
MKKVLFSAIVTGVVAFASCGGNHEDKAKLATDSARVADSMAAVKAQAAADSAAAAAAMATDTTKKDTAAAPATK